MTLDSDTAIINKSDADSASEKVREAGMWLRYIAQCFFGDALLSRNRPNQEMLVPDWLITSHVT